MAEIRLTGLIRRLSVTPKILLFFCALCIVLENIIIERTFAGLSPLGSQPIYALCYLLICAALSPAFIRKRLGMDVDWQRLREVWRWVLAAGLVFVIGAILFFQAFAKGGNAQLAMIMVPSILPILTAVMLSALDRRPPSARTVVACVMAFCAVMIIRSETPEGAGLSGGTAPVMLFLACAFCITGENIIIERKFAGLSPLGSQPIYGLCYLGLCMALFPLSSHLGMSLDLKLLGKVWLWVGAAGIIFAAGAIMLFQSFAKGGNAQLSTTMASSLPILMALVVCILERRLPSAPVVIASFLSFGALMVLRPEIPAAPAGPPSEEAGSTASTEPSPSA